MSHIVVVSMLLLEGKVKGDAGELTDLHRLRPLGVSRIFELARHLELQPGGQQQLKRYEDDAEELEDHGRCKGWWQPDCNEADMAAMDTRGRLKDVSDALADSDALISTTSHEDCDTWLF